MRDHLAQLDFAPGLWNDLLLHLHLLEMDLNGRSAHVDFRSLPLTRSASSGTRWISPAKQPQERHIGRDGADFQLKFAEHGRKHCCHDPPFFLTGIPSCPEPRRCSVNPNGSPQAPP